MQDIKGSVGENGTNTISDVALVQAILLKIKKTATKATSSTSYLTSYDGILGSKTKAAIRSFQTDHVFVTPDGKACANNPRATAGLIVPGDATWIKLIEKIPAEFSDMRILPEGKIVYVAATEQQLHANLAKVNTLTFTFAFRAKVIGCIRLMYSLYGIAIAVCPQGDRRTFQSQYDLLTSGRGVTKAGPGESNHNFGMAVDLGFEGLRWLQSNGNITENESFWLHTLEKQNLVSEALKFWRALRSVGTSREIGAFCGPVSDHPHLQNWSDAGVSMAGRLADLLTRSGTMRWSATRGSYSCDLGLGGALYTVGTAAQIWNRQASITIDMLTRARAVQPTQLNQHKQAYPPQQSNNQARLNNPKQANLILPPITQVDVTNMKNELRRQFELADANWENWTPR